MRHPRHRIATAIGYPRVVRSRDLLCLRSLLASGLLFSLACASGAPEGVAVVDEGPGLLRVSPEPVQFEETPSGCERGATLELVNISPDRAVTVTGLDLPNGAIRTEQAFPFGIAPGGRQSVELVFAPVTAGDWSGMLTLTTDEKERPAYPILAAAISATADPSQVASPPPAAPLDLVFVLDVSTTMYEMAKLRKAIDDLFDFLESSDLDVRFGLTSFENDVVVHGSGRFLSKADFFRELDSQLVEGTWVPNPELPRQLVNFDFPENTLDALHRSATEFPFREGARRYFILMTDDTFQEPPTIFSDGTPAIFDYDEVAATLGERQIRLFAVHERRRGRGFSSDYEGKPSLVRQTSGSWFELDDVEAGRLTLDALLADLVTGGVCEGAPRQLAAE